MLNKIDLLQLMEITFTSKEREMIQGKRIQHRASLKGGRLTSDGNISGTMEGNNTRIKLDIKLIRWYSPSERNFNFGGQIFSSSRETSTLKNIELTALRTRFAVFLLKSFNLSRLLSF